MNCKKCGYQLKENWKRCPKCGKNLNNSNIKNIYLIIFLIGILFFVNKFSLIGYLMALISIVTGFMKYPTNEIIKVCFWTFFLGSIIYILYTFILKFIFFSAIKDIGSLYV